MVFKYDIIMKKNKLLGILFLLVPALLSAQPHQFENPIKGLDQKIFKVLESKARAMETKVRKATMKYIQKLEKRYKSIGIAMPREDSFLLAKTFRDSKVLLNSAGSGEVIFGVPRNRKHAYSMQLDSLLTASKFLERTGNNLAGLREKYQKIQTQLDVSSQIKHDLISRLDILKVRFPDLRLLKKVQQSRIDAFYYESKIKELREYFETPTKAERKLLDYVNSLPQFKKFFAQHSMLSSMFALPGSDQLGQFNSSNGLQSYAAVNQQMIEKFGPTASVEKILRQQTSLQTANPLNGFKSKLSSIQHHSFGSLSADDIEGFRPNVQKTKPFLKRIVLGANIQSQPARYFFPVTTDIALSAGYKLNDRSILGVGIAYKFGWGRDWRHIQFTGQGIGLRSFIDWKIKTGYFISGGFEKNYRPLINEHLSPLFFAKHGSIAWQKSGLLGLTKKYKVNKKLKGEVRLLWDFLNYQAIPRTQPLLFRVGYTLK
jgi:hypothetical protein